MSEFKPVFSFGIDNNELAGMSPAETFTLGFELGIIWRHCDGLSKEAGYQSNVRIENRERIERMMNHFGREYTMKYQAVDQSESWMWLEIKPQTTREFSTHDE